LPDTDRSTDYAVCLHRGKGVEFTVSTDFKAFAALVSLATGAECGSDLLGNKKPAFSTSDHGLCVLLIILGEKCLRLITQCYF